MPRKHRYTLREKLLWAKKQEAIYSTQLFAGEEMLRQILKRRRFSYHQRKDLLRLLQHLHVPTMSERADKVLKDVYLPTIVKELNRPTRLLRLFR